MSQPNVYSISNTHFYCSLCVSNFDKSRQSIKQHQGSCEGATKMIESFTLQSSSATPMSNNFVSISSAANQVSTALDDCDYYSVGGASTGSMEGISHSRFAVQEDAIYYDFSQDQASPDRATLFSGELYHLSRAHAIPREYFDKSIKIVNNYVNGIMDPLQSTYICQKNKKETFPVKAITYAMCRNGCKMFSVTENDSTCEWCEAEARKRRKVQNETKRGRMDIKYLSLSAQLALILSDKNMREQMKLGRSQREEQSAGILEDFFDGELYKSMESELFTGEDDIAISLLTDGFLPFESKTPSMTIVHVVIWNLPPSIRYELRNMLQVCIIPGPRQPKDLESFLKPILEELKILQDSGLAVKVPSGDIIQAKVHLMTAFGDMPAVAKMCFHQGHSHKSGCRICRIKAYTQQIADSIINKKCLVFRQGEEVAIIRPASDYFEGNIEYGIRKPSMFNCLLSFRDPVYFFGLDIMHLVGHNAGGHFLEMLRGEYGRTSVLYLAPSVIQAIGSAMERSKKNIPKTFSGNFKDISSNSGTYRAVDWLAFMRYVVPTLAMEYCPEKSILGLIDVCNVALKNSVTYNDLDRAERGCKKWFAFLDQSIKDGLLDGSVYTVTQHCLGHIPMMTRKLGPLIRCSSFNLERAIQEYKRHIQSPSNPAANASNVLVDLAASRYEERSKTSTENIKQSNVLTNTNAAEDDPELWGPFKKVETDQYKGLRLSKLLRSFWSIYGDLGSNDVLDESITVASKLWKNSGIIFGCKMKESSKNGHRIQAYFAKLTIDVDTKPRGCSEISRQPRTFFGDILMLFQHEFKGEKRVLALVQVYGINVLNTGYLYISTVLSAARKLTVIDVEDIDCLAGKLDSAKFENRQYVIWPDMDIAKGFGDAPLGLLKQL